MLIAATKIFTLVIVYLGRILCLDRVVQRYECFLWQADEWVGELRLHDKVIRSGIKNGAIVEREHLTCHIPAPRAV